MDLINEEVENLWKSDIVENLDAVRDAMDAAAIITKDMYNILAELAAAFKLEDFRKILNLFEKKYKREKKVSYMPGAYRSSKSVLVNAKKHGVTIRDVGSLQIKGKTALEKEIRKAKKKEQEDPKNPTNPLQHVMSAQPKEYYIDLADTFLRLAKHTPNPTNSNSEETKELLDGILVLCGDLRIEL